MLLDLRTVEKWKPCERREGERYSRKGLLKLSNNRWAMSSEEIFQLDIRPLDLIWLFGRREVLGQDGTIRLAAKFANHVSYLGFRCVIDPLLDSIEEYLNGDVTDEDMEKRCIRAMQAFEAVKREYPIGCYFANISMVEAANVKSPKVALNAAIHALDAVVFSSPFPIDAKKVESEWQLNAVKEAVRELWPQT